MSVLLRTRWDRNLLRASAALIFTFALVVLVRTAWLCDDAYITFRSVENFVGGYGLVWNVAERVQSFTHPLWMLLLSAVHFFSGEIYFTSIGLSIFLSMGALLVLVYGIAYSRSFGLALVIVLLFSRSFVDYSTGGLENSLTHLLLALFVILYNRDTSSRQSLFFLSLCAALCTLNRLDTVLLTGPALTWVGYRQRGWWAVLTIVAGFAPFIAWELFSLIYYGFLIPNSALAKLGAGLTRWDKLRLGSYFYAYTWKHDPLTLPAILIGVVAPLIRRDGRRSMLSLGIALYLFYILSVGGVYMGGRMLTAPLFLAVLLFASLPITVKPGTAMLTAVVAAMISLCQPFAPVSTGVNFGVGVKRPVMDPTGIDDCRQSHYEWTGLLRWIKYGEAMPIGEWAGTGRAFRAGGAREVYTRRAIGIAGYLAGPSIHFVDYYALADPLLARLPAVIPWWRTCHYGRHFPEGYIETLRSGLGGAPIKNQLTDPNLAAFYDHLDVIIRGPLFTVERFKTIALMNLGYYDSLIDGLFYRFPAAVERRYEEVRSPIQEGIPWRSPGTIEINKSMLRIRMAEATHAEELEISLDHNDSYRLYFFRDDRLVGMRTIAPEVRGGMRTRVVGVPLIARWRGFTDLIVEPMTGDGMYSFGHLNLVE